MRGKRKLGGWLFLALAILAQAATALVEPALARQALAAFLTMLGEVAPVLALVLVLMYLTERFLTPERTRAWLGHDSGLRGWLLAVLAGVISTGPVYTWYALLADLRRKGMRTALVAVVLYARAIKLPLLPLLAHYFGLTYMVVLSLFIAAFSIVNGLAMERLVRQPAAE
ncbi:MAG: permease [Hydrogenophilaceae bacterium]|nr:permease [Hydrogenophilaceae bacterium]